MPKVTIDDCSATLEVDTTTPRMRAMMKPRRTLGFVIVGALTVTGAPTRATDTKPAANVELQTSRGTTARLSDFKGSVVLLDFWASWCPPCKKSFPAINALYRDFHRRGLEVLAVNMDERRRDADSFLSAHSHVMPVFFDPRGAALQALGVLGLPTALLIDRSGNIRFTHIGYSERIGEQCRPEIDMLLKEP